MVQLAQTFRPDEVEDADGFDVIPKGEYPMQFVESSEAANKGGTGRILTLVAEIIDGQYQGRKIWVRVNYVHENQLTQTIAEQTLKSFTTAMGFVGDVEDSDEMHFKPFIGCVSIRKDKSGQYDDQNDIRRAKPMNGSAASGQRRSGPGQIGNGGNRAAPGAGSARQTGNGGAAASRPGPGGPGNRPWPNRAQQQPVDEEIPF